MLNGIVMSNIPYWITIARWRRWYLWATKITKYRRQLINRWWIAQSAAEGEEIVWSLLYVNNAKFIFCKTLKKKIKIGDLNKLFKFVLAYYYCICLLFVFSKNIRMCMGPNLLPYEATCDDWSHLFIRAEALRSLLYFRLFFFLLILYTFRCGIVVYWARGSART